MKFPVKYNKLFVNYNKLDTKFIFKCSFRSTDQE